MNSKEKLQDLHALKLAIESRAFQEYIMKPVLDELDKEKNAYECETLKELWLVKGKKDGLKFIIKTLKEIDREIKNARFDLENSPEE